MSSKANDQTVVDQPRRIWAAKQLGLPPSATLAEARCALGRQLPDVQFVPAESCHAALDQWTVDQNGSSVPNQFYASDCEPELADDVESIAEQLFQLPLTERRQRMQQLEVRCVDFPRLELRLRAFESAAAVALEDVPASAPLVRQLAEMVCRLAVLKPLPRALARQAAFAELSQNIKSMEAAVRELRKLYPEIAALGKDFLDEVALYRKHSQKIAAAKRAAIARNTPAPRTIVKKNGESGARWSWLVAAVALAVMRTMISSDHSYSPPPPSRNVPTVPIYAPPNVDRSFDGSGENNNTQVWDFRKVAEQIDRINRENTERIKQNNGDFKDPLGDGDFPSLKNDEAVRKILDDYLKNMRTPPSNSPAESPPDAARPEAVEPASSSPSRHE